MRDVVIIGGGLSGLAAAYELEQHHVDYSLIEVKRQPGGSLRTIEQDGFVMDAGAMVVQDNFDAALLDDLGLQSALIPAETPATEDNTNPGGIAFASGTQQLIDAFMQTVTAPLLKRMAVSSVGDLNAERFAICLENGIMWDAGALIIAAPARYAERMFYSYIPDVGRALLDYHYDTIQRISLGYADASALPDDLAMPPDMGYVFAHRITHPARVPDGGALLQVGIRIDPQRNYTDADLIQLVTQVLDLPAPQTHHVAYWAEADPISCYDDDHPAQVQRIRDQLPDGIALIGSDYSLSPPQQRGIVDLAGRIQQGRRAARQVLQTR